MVSIKHLKLVKDSVTTKLDTLTNLDGISEDSRLVMMDDLHLAVTGVTCHSLNINSGINILNIQCFPFFLFFIKIIKMI